MKTKIKTTFLAVLLLALVIPSGVFAYANGNRTGNALSVFDNLQPVSGTPETVTPSGFQPSVFETSRQGFDRNFANSHPESTPREPGMLLGFELSFLNFCIRSGIIYIDSFGLREVFSWLKHFEFSYQYWPAGVGIFQEGVLYWKPTRSLSDFEKARVTGTRRYLGRRESQVRIPSGGSYRVLREIEFDRWIGEVFEVKDCYLEKQGNVWKPIHPEVPRQWLRNEVYPRYSTLINEVWPRNRYPTSSYPSTGFFSLSNTPKDAFPKYSDTQIDGQRRPLYEKPIELPVNYDVVDW